MAIIHISSPNSADTICGTYFDSNNVTKEKTTGIKKISKNEQNEHIKVRYSLLVTPDFLIDEISVKNEDKVKCLTEGQNLPLSIFTCTDGSLSFKINKQKYKPHQWKAGAINLYSGKNIPTESIHNKNGYFQSSLFSITENYLRRLSLDSPSLFEPILENYSTGKDFLLHQQPTPSPITATSIIKQIKTLPLEDPLSPILLQSKFLELLYLSFKNKETNEAHKLELTDKDKIIEAKHFLLENYKTPPSLFELALHVGTNTCKIKQGFKQLFNTTAYSILSEHRIKIANKYLKDTNYTLSEIADEVGFEHHSSFTRAYKRQIGISPTQFRKKHGKND